MPELPDAVVYERYIRDHAFHQSIASVHVGDPYILGGPTVDGLERALVGKKLVDTRRHGKHVFAQLSASGWLGLHFGMTGRPRYYDGDDHPEYAYFRVGFDGGAHLALICPRKLARVRLIDAPEAFIEEKKLGPDAYRIDYETFTDALDGRYGAIKGILMNQQVMAGLGNIYADEVLYQVGIHPATKTNQLTADQKRRIYDAIEEVLEAAIEVDANPTRLPADRFMLPHRYGDEQCPHAGVALETEQVSGRTAYFSPARQPRPAED